jgi:hypothetical protein
MVNTIKKDKNKIAQEIKKRQQNTEQLIGKLTS